jgi:hypothetical protein
MRHLSEAELVDLAEGTRTEFSAPHLAECDACRQHIEMLRGVIAATASADVPEPSPLFWDHLSTRVHAAVEAESAHRAPAVIAAVSGVPSWARSAAVWSGLAAAILVAMLVVRVRVPARPTNISAAADTVASSGVATAADDPALMLMAQLAGGMDEDAASQLAPADSTAHTGVVEESVTFMSQSEREELGRLISEEMRRPGW